MLKASRIRPYVAQLLLRVVPAGFGFVVAVLLVQRSGVTVYGEYSVALVLATMTLVLASNCLDSDALRLVGFAGAKEYAAKLGAAAFLMPLFLGLAVWQELPLIPSLAIFSAVMWSAVADTRVVELRKTALDLWAIPVRLGPVCIFIVFLLQSEDASFSAVSAMYLGAWCLVPLLLWRRVFAAVAVLRPHVLKSRFLAVKWIALSLLMTQIQGNLDALILNKWLGPDVVGQYRIAVLVGNLGLQVVGVTSFIFLSRLGDLTDLAEKRKVFWSQVRLNGGIGVFFVIVVAAAFNPVIVPLFKLVPGEVRTLAVVIAMGAAVNGVAMAASYFLLAHGKDRKIFAATVFAAVASAAGNFVAIPRYGAFGAAVVSLLTQIVSLASCSVALISAGLLARNTSDKVCN